MELVAKPRQIKTSGVGGRSVLLILVLGVFNLNLEDGLSIITWFGFLICFIGFMPGKIKGMKLKEFFGKWNNNQTILLILITPLLYHVYCH